MKKLLFAPALFVLISALSLQAAPKDDVTAAAQKLGEAKSYSWKTSIETAGNNRFRGGPVEGRSAAGVVQLTLTRGDNTIEAYLQDKKGAVKWQDDWQSLSEAAESEGGGRFVGRMLQGYRAPAEEVEKISGHVRDWKSGEGVISGMLTEDGVKELLSRGGRRDGAAPAVRDAKGTARFWIKEGALVKYEYRVEGAMDINGNDVTVDRTVTVDIKDVGRTEIMIPEAAKKKIS